MPKAQRAVADRDIAEERELHQEETSNEEDSLMGIAHGSNGRAPAPKAPPRKLAPNPYARRPDDDDDRKRRRDADLGNLATDKNVLRNRAVACNKKRAKIFGRTVGKGRLLPVYNDDV